MRKATLIVLVLVMGLVGVQIAQAATAGPLVQVSGASPFGALEDCGNFPTQVPFFPPSENFVNSEVEPWVVVNPVDQDNIVGFWQQDRWSDGGSRGNVAGVSFDGGAAWQIVPVPGLTDCTGGPWERASDPWLSFSPDGTLHQMSLVFQTDPPARSPFGFGPNGMAVSKSEDGGLTWSDPITIVEDDNPRFLNDKNSMTADPTDVDFVYAVWDKLNLSPGGIMVNRNGRGGLGSFKGAAFFARSTDGGDSWEEPSKLYDPGGLNQTIGNQIVVLPDGTLVDFFTEILNARNDDGGAQPSARLSFKYSPDRGETWLPKGRPIRTNEELSLGIIPPFFPTIVTPDDEVPVRDASILFDVAVDPDSGNLYAVWQDARFSDFEIDQVAFSMSTDGGFTWSQPIKVSQSPASSDGNILDEQAFLPSVEVAGGVVGVSYYDFRNDDGTGELADHWLVTCDGNCSDSSSWTSASEVRLTDASFDYTTAPRTGAGFFLGDYVGLASYGADFLAFFQQSSAADPGDGYFRRVTP
jgi:hypothetical protein